MLDDPELKRLHWRAHQRGTREADMLVGGFFDAHHAGWTSQECAMFDAMLNEQDVDIMAWAHGKGEAPAAFSGPLMAALRRLDYIKVAR
jgi:antitoxin CptB